MTLSSVEYLSIIGFLSALLVFTELRNYHERRNLLDRLMARDFSDLVKNERRRNEEPADPDNIHVAL